MKKNSIKKFFTRVSSAVLAAAMAAGGMAGGFGGMQVQAAAESVTVTKGGSCSYSEEGLGTWVTNVYNVDVDDHKTSAYCLAPSKSAPKSGTFSVTKLPDNSNLAKVLYYGGDYQDDSNYFHSPEYEALLKKMDGAN